MRRTLRISRRRLLAWSAAAPLACPRLWAAPLSGSAERFVLLSDIHIPQDRNESRSGVKPVEHFLRAQADILGLAPHAAAIFINGDCAYLEGRAGDYAALQALLAPFGQAGVPVHMTLGNHDHRAHFLAAFAEDRPTGVPPVAGRHVSIVETPLANWFLLDSLKQTLYTPGELGAPQLAWLEGALDARPDKAALVAVHHHLDPLGTIRGLLDTDQLLRVLVARRQVKACLFGHTHRWEYTTQEGLHLINLPALAWVFDKRQPQGWIDAQLRSDGLSLAMHCIDPGHAGQRPTVDLKWR